MIKRGRILALRANQNPRIMKIDEASERKLVQVFVISKNIIEEKREVKSIKNSLILVKKKYDDTMI